MCTKSVTGATINVTCFICGGKCHMSCIVNGFKASHGKNFNTSYQRQADFLQYGNFHFTSNHCVDTKKSLVTTSLGDNSVAENGMSKCVNELQSKMVDIVKHLNNINVL